MKDQFQIQIQFTALPIDEIYLNFFSFLYSSCICHYICTVSRPDDEPSLRCWRFEASKLFTISEEIRNIITTLVAVAESNKCAW